MDANVWRIDKKVRVILNGVKSAQDDTEMMNHYMKSITSLQKDCNVHSNLQPLRW